MTRPRTRTLLVAGAAVLTLAACSSSGDGDGGSSTPPTPPPTVSDTPTPSPTPSSTSPTPTAASTTPSATPSSSSTPTPSATPSASSAPEFTTTCTKLTVQVIPGGAIRGAEIAALQYINGGTGTCTITGVPSAVLLRGGKVIGTPAGPNGTKATAFTLAPGEVGESLLRDFSTCNAPLSDSIRVTTPVRGGGSTTAVRPAKLRACTLELAPVGPPA